MQMPEKEMPEKRMFDKTLLKSDHEKFEQLNLKADRERQNMIENDKRKKTEREKTEREKMSKRLFRWIILAFVVKGKSTEVVNLVQETDVWEVVSSNLNIKN